MPNFKYTAKDKAGRAVTGVLEALDERAAVVTLRRQELIVISVLPEKKKSGT
ncbi:MAG: type II secretion system F family protein, partial [Candidatus Omnitrophica bacterium]|nr:type II secretion system F family protein [Candidatus Omnitrophota bacterium]